jgi:hypothetical protein
VDLPVPSEISHWIGNENQDTVALLENYADVDKKGDATPRSKGLHEIYEVRLEIGGGTWSKSRCMETQDCPWLGVYAKYKWLQPFN